MVTHIVLIGYILILPKHICKLMNIRLPVFKESLEIFLSTIADGVYWIHTLLVGGILDKYYTWYLLVGKV